MNGAKYREVLDKPAPELSGWRAGSPSSWTMTLSTQPNSCAVTLPIQHDREKWEKLPKYRCANLVASYTRRLEAVNAGKGVSTKY
jgi:hypothetical protein